MTTPGDHSSKGPVVLWIVGLIAAAGYFVNIWPAYTSFWVGVVTKPIPVLGMAIWVLSRSKDRYAIFLAAGLLLAMIGDIILLGHSDSAFMGGLLANLLAHIAYIVAFTLDNRTLRPLRLLPYLVWVGGLFVFIYPGLNGMEVPVALYSTAIMCMMWRAAARVGKDGPVRFGEVSGALGAILFAVCDSLIALTRFSDPIAFVSYPIMITYWFGQLGIAWSVVRTPPD